MLRNLGCLARLSSSSRPAVLEGKALVVTIRGFDHGRYGFQLLNYFSRGGYRIFLYRSSGFLLKLRDYDRMVWQLPGIATWRNSMADAKGALPWLTLGYQGRRKPPFTVSVRLTVDLDYFGTPASTGPQFHLPYFVHPLLNPYVPCPQSFGRRRSVFMYGEPGLSYDSTLIEGRFGLASRSAVFNRLLATEPDAFMPDDFDDLMRRMDSKDDGGPQVCLVDTRRFRIPLERWLEVLSRFNFFIATPGICMPHSHNLMEALAAGAIPILQYHESLKPALTPGVDCIAFSDLDDLEARLDDVKKMEVASIGKMREAVHRYFLDHVDPVSVVNRLMTQAHATGRMRLFFNAEEQSLYRRS